MAHDLITKLALVKEGKMLTSAYAIEVARRPEFVERARNLKMSEELLVNVLTDVVWDVVMDLPSVFVGKFDQSLAEYYSTAPQEEKGTKQRCPKCKKLFRIQGIGIHMRKIHGIEGIKATAKKQKDNRTSNTMQECPKCHKQFKGLVGLGSHLAKIHNIRGEGITKLPSSEKPSLDSTKRVEMNKMPSDMITDCPTCKEVGFRAIRYQDHYTQVGAPATREYWYGLVHETDSKKEATFHRQTKLAEDAAKKRAEKYHQFNAKGETVIPSPQQKQSAFFAKKVQ